LVRWKPAYKAPRYYPTDRNRPAQSAPGPLAADALALIDRLATDAAP
jgi:hypothetical protein